MRKKFILTLAIAGVFFYGCKNEYKKEQLETEEIVEQVDYKVDISSDVKSRTQQQEIGGILPSDFPNLDIPQGATITNIITQEGETTVEFTYPHSCVKAKNIILSGNEIKDGKELEISFEEKTKSVCQITVKY